jgi:hypothetical protein
LYHQRHYEGVKVVWGPKTSAFALKRLAGLWKWGVCVCVCVCVCVVSPREGMSLSPYLCVACLMFVGLFNVVVIVFILYVL